jgi:predicted kinase
MADVLLEPPPPRLIAIGGLSGSGKSTLARALAPSTGAAPGAVVIRSDAIRKKLCGVKPLDRLGAEGYTDEVSRRVYATLMEQADLVVGGGHTAIVDAVFEEAADREAVQHVAAAAGVPFVGLWLEAPTSLLISRVEGRGPDVSDAGSDVIQRQIAHRMDWILWPRLDATGTRQQVCDAGGAVLGDQNSGPATRRRQFAPNA